ncbi:MAG: hypothetical protein GY913_19655 [Proteobacteria bacterium]|nr:hypothetical protein [Pseudomonadota bacterium]MCP4919125.1 hypothetical protein [Pseudomonadota bacterium]
MSRLRDARRSMGLALLALPLVASTCTEAEVAYEQVNDASDALTVEVGVADELEAVQADLTSNTGAVVVGVASVSPGGGPVGTIHTVSVVVDDAYEDQVDLVRIVASADKRDDREFDLTQDAFDEGIWVMEIESFGGADEVRTDTLGIQLLDVTGDDDEPVVSEDTGA